MVDFKDFCYVGQEIAQNVRNGILGFRLKSLLRQRKEYVGRDNRTYYRRPILPYEVNTSSKTEFIIEHDCLFVLQRLH